MDYLFIPGTGLAETRGRKVLPRRPNTTLINRPAKQNHVAGFLHHLTTSPAIARPIGDILFVAHGLETGFYDLPLSSLLASPTDFEKAFDANASDAVRLTAPLLTPTGGGAMNEITVHLIGCNVGAARPLVEKLFEAMRPAGGPLTMLAPLHFDEFHAIGGGHVQYLAHKFTVRAPKKFLRPDGRSADRPALLAAFDAEKFTFLDGTEIPADAWKGFIPTNIHPPRAKWKQAFDIEVGLSPAIGTQTTVKIRREYRFEAIPFSWTWGAPDPGNHADRLEVLRTTLPQGKISGRPLYDPSYPWPLNERYGFSDIDEMVDSLEWTVTPNPKKGLLHFRAE